MKNSIAFFTEVGRLKTLPRTGWVNRGIPSPETVAEHMYRSQFVAYDLAKAFNENAVACAHMMMIHDLPEAKAGDITPDCGISNSDKATLEMDAARELAELSGNPEFLKLFEEYEEGKTLQSRICRDADQLECLIQALEYAAAYPDKRASLEDFWPYAKKKITTEVGDTMYQELLAKKQCLQGMGL
mgnify:CR=1 FL=1